MCNLSQSVFEQGVEEGEIRGRVTSILSLMDSFNFSPEQAMRALKIPKEEYQTYTGLVKKEQLKQHN